MSSCGSNKEGYAAKRRRELQQDINNGAFVDWSTEEEIAARRADMERSVLEEVRRVPSRRPAGEATRESRPSNPTFVGSINYQHVFSHNAQGRVPPRPESFSIPVVSEAHRVADQFCEQYRVLREEVEILQEENTRLRRMLQRFLTPITVVPPSPPRE